MLQKQKKIICIRCPQGCEISTTIDGYEIKHIQGNVCKLGKEYVYNEIKDPRRIVTTTVKVKNSKTSLVPVWTSAPIPKDKIFELTKMLKKIKLAPPIEMNQIVIKNIFNLGIDVITSGVVKK